MFQLSEERDELMLQLQTTKEQLSDIMQMMEGMEMAKGNHLSNEHILHLVCSMRNIVETYLPS